MTRLTFLLPLIALIGCVTMGGSRFETQFDKSSKAEDSLGKLTITSFEARRLNINFKNKSSSTSKIIWDEVVIVDANNSPRKIMHNGVKYINAGQTMTPSIVPANGEINDFLAYADGVTPIGNGDWLEDLILPCSQAGQICSPDQYYGKTISVIFPVENNGKKIEYTAKFNLLRPVTKK